MFTGLLHLLLKLKDKFKNFKEDKRKQNKKKLEELKVWQPGLQLVKMMV